jgi:tetratricopeptide (TPR) repeat protein
MLAGTASAAQDARSIFDVATRRYDVGDYERACAGFRQAYVLEPRATLLVNLGVCARRRGNLREAMAYFRRFLVKSPNAPIAKNVERLLADTEAEARRLDEIVLPNFDGNLLATDSVDDDPKEQVHWELRDPFSSDSDQAPTSRGIMLDL